MRIGDSVLIPSEFSRSYCLAAINGEYVFDENENEKLYHSRSITIIEQNIPRDIFEQSIIYSLGAYRTIFHVKYEKNN